MCEQEMSQLSRGPQEHRGDDASRSTPPQDTSERCPQKSSEVRSGDAPVKPCCACPETKKARDECIIRHGESACVDAINAHIACMRAHRKQT